MFPQLFRNRREKMNIFKISLTWLSIHFNPTAAVHSFLEALVNQSRWYSLSNVSRIIEILLLQTFAENISPLELMFVLLFNDVLNHSLPDLCVDSMAKCLIGLHSHSSLIIYITTYQCTNMETRLWTELVNVLPSKSFWVLGSASKPFSHGSILGASQAFQSLGNLRIQHWCSYWFAIQNEQI